jgi:hypothetical protein
MMKPKRPLPRTTGHLDGQLAGAYRGETCPVSVGTVMVAASTRDSRCSVMASDRSTRLHNALFRGDESGHVPTHAVQLFDLPRIGVVEDLQGVVDPTGVKVCRGAKPEVSRPRD